MPSRRPQRPLRTAPAGAKTPLRVLPGPCVGTPTGPRRRTGTLGTRNRRTGRSVCYWRNGPLGRQRWTGRQIGSLRWDSDKRGRPSLPSAVGCRSAAPAAPRGTAAVGRGGRSGTVSRSGAAGSAAQPGGAASRGERRRAGMPHSPGASPVGLATATVTPCTVAQAPPELPHLFSGGASRLLPAGFLAHKPGHIRRSCCRNARAGGRPPSGTDPANGIDEQTVTLRIPALAAQQRCRTDPRAGRTPLRRGHPACPRPSARSDVPAERTPGRNGSPAGRRALASRAIADPGRNRRGPAPSMMLRRSRRSTGFARKPTNGAPARVHEHPDGAEIELTLLRRGRSLPPRWGGPGLASLPAEPAPAESAGAEPR